LFGGEDEVAAMAASVMPSHWQQQVQAMNYRAMRVGVGRRRRQ
jgi:hypothetical protein